MKRVLIVYPLLPKYNVEFLEKFLSLYNGFDIYVTADIAVKNDLNLRDYAEYDFKVFHTNIKIIGPFHITLGLGKIIKRINPHLIIYTASPRDLGQMASIILQKIAGRKIAIWSMFHRIGGPRLYSTLYYKFLGIITDRNFTYSTIGKNYQIARGVNHKKIDVIGTAIDEKKVFSIIEKYSDNQNDLEKVKKEYNIEGKYILLQVVRLTKIKKPFFLIDMMKDLLKKEPDTILILIGGGELESSLKEYVRKLKLDDNVLFLGAIYDEKVLNLWFSIANIFVMPTCIGLSAHHACCYGLPIVTDNSFINQASEFDILCNGFNCILYEEQSIDSFVEKILELKNNPSLCKKLSDNAKLTVKEQYTLENKCKNLKISIDKILKTKE